MNRLVFLFLFLLPLSSFAADIKILSLQAKVVRGYSSGFRTAYSLDGSNVYLDYDYYLSDDAVLDETDRFIYTKNVLCFTSPQGYYSFYTEFNLEAFPAANFLIAVVNRNRSLQETDYSNNIAATRIVYEDQFHDLDVYQFSTINQQEQIQGNSIRLLTRLQNSGNVNTVASFKIFLSSDQVLDAADREVFSHTGGELKPGGIQSLVIYDHTATQSLLGPVYFIIKADPADVYEEKREDNNTKIVSFTFKAENYEVAAGEILLETPYNSAGAVSSFSFNYTNTGETRARDSGRLFTVSYILSADQQLSQDDLLVTTAQASVPQPGASQTIYYHNVPIPSSFSAATSAYLFCVVDRESNLSMDSKANNTSMLEVRLQPQKPHINIRPGYNFFLGGFLVKPSGSLTTDFIIENRGTKEAIVKASYYLSKDAVWDLQDVLVKEADFGQVPSRSSAYKHDFQLFSQFNFPAGHYYIIQVEDQGNLVDEVDEGRNVSFFPLYCAENFNAEFSFEYIAVSKEEASSGEVIWLRYYIMQTTDAEYSIRDLYTQVYLSEDEHLDEEDIVYANLANGSTGSFSAEITIPDNWQSDKLYVITQINGEKLIEENFYHNNTSVNLIRIKRYAPAMAGIAAVTANEHEQITFTVSATDADTPASSLRYSLGENAPEGASIDAVSGIFSWVPTEVQGPATYAFTIKVSDGTLTDEKRVSISVGEVNEAPVITSLPVTTVKVGEAYHYQLLATDADLPANILSFGAGTLPSWLTFDVATRQLSGTPAEADVQAHAVELSVHDGEAVVTQTFNITVEGPTGLADGIPVKGSQLKLYPNPSKGRVGLLADGLAPGSMLSATVTTLDGRQLLKTTATLEKLQVQLNALMEVTQPGIYILSVSWDNEHQQLKLIKQ